MEMSTYYKQQMEEALELARKYERCPEDEQKAAGAADARRTAEYYRNLMEEAIAEENMNNEKENDNMKTEFTTLNGTHFESNDTYTYFYATWTDAEGKTTKKRIKKAEFEAAQRENDIERKMAELDDAAENPEVTLKQFCDKIILTENDGMVTITPEDIERDARELEAYIANAEEDAKTEEAKEIADLYCRHPEGTDLQVPAVLNQYGCVDCSKCNVQNCVHRDCMRRNPTSEGGLAECPRLKVELPKPKKAKAAKKNAAYVFSNGGVEFTLTAKQVDFILHLSDTYFWEDGLDSCIWVDCLCDDIKGQFAGKPMTVGAMISTICEKGLGVRATNRRDNRKCTSFALTDWGKAVAKDLGLR